MFISILKKYPFIRLLIPFIAGIIAGDTFFLFYKDAVPVFLLPTGILFILLLKSYRVKKYTSRLLFGYFLYPFLFLSGLCVISSRQSQTYYSFAPREVTYRGIITRKPEVKQNSILCTTELTTYYDSENSFPIRKKVILYLPPDEKSKTLKSGDELIFYSRISLSVKRGNPDEFDYGRYLIRHNISGTAYVPDGYWKVTGNHAGYSLQKRAFDLRDKIVEKYRQLGFDKETLAILSALTVGYKEELSEEIRESFSVSGAGHILALSGLHIGFIYGFLAFLLNFLPGRIKSIQWFKAVIILLLLWMFAFITGLSPSIVRSVIMFSVFVLSKIISGRAFSMNSLCVAAFTMLVFRPGWLFDVGFQLSFCAVAAILIIQPRLEKKINVKNRISRYILTLITVSVAAQIGTAPLVMYYFSRFSTHFLLTNLMVIPLVFLIIHLAVIMLLFTPLPAIQQILADTTQYVINLLTGSVRLVEQLPFSSFDHIRLSGGEVILLYGSIVWIAACLFYRKLRYVVFCLITLIGINIYRAISVHAVHSPPRIVFYNIRNCPVVHCIDKNRNSRLIYADTLPDRKNPEKAIVNYSNRLRLSGHTHIVNDYEDDNLLRINHMVWYYGKKIAIIHHNEYTGKFSENVFPVDYLYVCNGYQGDMASLLKLYAIGQVILDTTLPVYKRERLIKECNELGLKCISIHRGAHIISL